MQRSSKVCGSLLVAIVTLAVSAGRADAFSHRVCGQELDLRVAGPGSPRQEFRADPWINGVPCPASNPSFPIPLPTPVSIDDPTLSGGTIRFKDSLGGAVTYILPAPGWGGLGNPAGSTGYKYLGAGTVADPCLLVRVRTTDIDAICKSPSGLTLPLTGTGQVTLTVGGGGSSYCAEFGGINMPPPTTSRHRRLRAARPAPGYPCP
jgi:hypothetical protein